MQSSKVGNGKPRREINEDLARYSFGWRLISKSHQHMTTRKTIVNLDMRENYQVGLVLKMSLFLRHFY